MGVVGQGVPKRKGKGGMRRGTSPELDLIPFLGPLLHPGPEQLSSHYLTCAPRAYSGASAKFMARFLCTSPDSETLHCVRPESPAPHPGPHAAVSGKTGKRKEERRERERESRLRLEPRKWEGKQEQRERQERGRMLILSWEPGVT